MLRHDSLAFSLILHFEMSEDNLLHTDDLQCKYFVYLTSDDFIFGLRVT